MNSIYAAKAALRQSVFSICTLLISATSVLAQPVTTAWIFDGNVLTGTSTQAAVTANNATYGPGLTSPGFSGGNPSTGRAISGAGWGSGNPSTFLADDYFGFSFTVAATPCQVVKLTNLTFDSQRSGTGPATWEVRTSLDNFAAVVATGSNPTAFAMQTAALTQTVMAGQTFEVRVYGYGATGTAGTLRLDNVNINGTIQQGPSAAVLSGSSTFCLSGDLNFSVSVTGGFGPYTVVYTDGTSDFTQNNYTSGATITRNVTQTTTFTLVSVTDANGCAAPNLSGSATANVSTNPPAITFQVTQPTCANNDGAINATITGGTAPLTYTWTTVGGSGLVPGQEDQSGLSAGAYTLVVSDPFTCSDSETATLSIPANCADCPSASVLNVVNVDCNNPTGSITFGASGGNPPYQFNIGGGAQSSGVFTGLAPGAYTVTVTDAGNCTQTVTTSATVQNLPDTQAPNFDQNPLPQNLTLSCTATVPPPATLTATDNCDGPVPVTLATNTTPGTCPQNSTITRTWTATDAAGNSRQHTQLITISDTQAPTLNGTPAATLSISCELPLPTPPSVTAMDNCDTNVPVNFSENSTPGTCPQRRTVTRTWTATDDCGNATSFVQTITVTDNVPPVFDQPLPPATETISCTGNIPMIPQVTATDNCDPGQVPAVIFINEIHYDNTGTDVGEFVEVAGTAGLNLANYALVLYNGNGGVTYDTIPMTGTIDNEGNGFGAVSFSALGIQNGSPDGLALVTLPAYTVLQFLSYEGSFAATNGPAMGMMATDIGVLEDGTNAVGTSVQLTGTGQQAAQFTWVGPLTASAGSLNVGQTINPLPATIVATVMQTMMMGNCNGEMTVMRTWTAADACGNSVQYTQTIVVEDNSGPTFAPPLPQNITLNCTDPIPPAATLIATDACDIGAPMEPWINEMHYDNAGADVGEFFEIAGPAGINLAEYSLFLYNGAGGGTYGSMTLSGTIDNEQNGFGAVSFLYPANGLQNGAPDGVALVHGGMVVQFLSYEGVFTAVGGPANGMLSTDIGVFETGTEPAGQSLRLSGTGNKYSDFVWNNPAAATPGSVNTGQSFTAVPPAFPVTFNETMSGPPANCIYGKTITRTWSVEDDCGNGTTHTQIITVTDNIAPTVTCQPLTVNLNIFGQATVNQSQITFTATDNCSPTTALTVLPNTQTYTCANAATPPPFILSVRDQCGNVGTCSVAITIPAFARCTPKILITEPCVCKNNATTLSDGQFGETIKIESLSGKVWTVTQATGLYAANSPAPPSLPLPIVGTVLTENPANSGDYYLNGIHIDALGYTVTIVSQQGEVLTIGNSCAYPNPEILSNLDGPFCLYSDSVVLVGNPGDLNIVSASFTINGKPATAFKPSDGVGQYIIEYTVNGGVPKASGPNDPGCIQKVSKTVNVVATPDQLSCNDQVYFSLDADCSEEIRPDDILEGSYGCFDDYRIRLTTVPLNQPVNSNVMTSLNIGKTYKATVTHLVSGNSCWGLITIEDKLAPTITCQDITITCAVAEYSPDYLKNVLKFNQATPTVADCSPVTLTYKDTWVDLPCGQGFNGVADLSAYLKREWLANDVYNNFVTCTQYIYLKRRHVQDVKFPTDIEVSCSNPNTDPDATGAPWFEDFGLKFYLYPNTAYCEINAVFADNVLNGCGASGYEIIRTWTVYDWCLPTNPGPTGTLNPRTFIQVIKVKDNVAPTFTCPAALTVSTDPNTCCGTINLPDVLVSDNCSKPTKIWAKVEGVEPLTGAPFGYDVTGGFADFPGNNYWNPDTLGVLGTTPCLPLGTHLVTYRAQDECDNIRSCTFNMTVADLVPPVPACIDVVQVALTNTGQTQIPAEAFDNGSYDNCGKVTVRAGRSSGSGGTTIAFNCSDIGKTLTVFLVVTDESGNTNECMVNALVEDKLKPLCTPPASVTVNCENFDPTLWPYGKATGLDNCNLNPITTVVDYSLFDTLCNRGTIVRVFTASDKANNSSTCSQRIVVTYGQDYYVRFPDDRLVTVCDGTGNFGEPTFYDKDCEMLGVSYTDEVFTVVPDACFKIERTWNVINWCQYNPNVPLTEVPNPNPNATVNAPANNVGAVISASSNSSIIAAPWTATRLAIVPGAQPTDYSVFYHGGTYTLNNQTITVTPIGLSNGFSYKQIIKVVDGQDPVVEDCPSSPDTICDYTPNAADLWNESYWYDGLTEQHDLCEGPADLKITATDACSGALVNFRYLLFLDTDNNGSMETVVSSTNLPGFNRINYNNALTPGYTGGTPQSFDERPVPANQKYGFALQVTTSGTKRTAAVRWNTFQQQNNYVVPELPYGKHKIKWFVDDGCGNEATCEYLFEVKDCKAPTVVCKNGLSVNIMPTGMIIMWASDFLQYTEDNCTPAAKLRIAIRRVGQPDGQGNTTGFPRDADGTPQTSVFFTCNDLGQQEVELWSIDLAGNADFCQTYLIVQDNASSCATDKATVAGALKTEDNQGLEEALVEVASGLGALTDLSDKQGAYLIPKAIPFGSHATITPTNDQNPLNGVSTYDLVLISKHILGLELLDSPYKMIAADANRSGSITTFDIVELRKLILGIYTELPNNMSWRFVDRKFVFNDLTNPFKSSFPENISLTSVTAHQFDQDFVAIKVGDVNGSATPNSLVNSEDRSGRTLLLDLVERNVQAGEVFETNFRTSEIVTGFQFTLNLKGLEVADVLGGDRVSAANFGLFSDALTVSLDGVQEFTVRFRATQAGALSDMLRVSGRITRAEAYAVVEPKRMEVALRFATPQGPVLSGMGFELYQNQPNPFEHNTLIGFYLPQAAVATLTVFDESGRILYTQRGDFAAGYQVMPVSLTAGAGMLYYRIETATDSATRKMVRQ